LGDSKYEEPWLDWASGNISTKWPDTALYRKMLSIASALRARVQDDDGKIYCKLDDWLFDPTASSVAPRKTWLHRVFGKSVR
jgi:hypothetical protein